MDKEKSENGSFHAAATHSQQQKWTENRQSSAINGHAKNESKVRITTKQDGGWGWMVVLAVFVQNLLIDGVVGCFGLLYPEILKEFSASPAVTSLVGSMVVGTFLVSSLLWGVCIRLYGCRLVCFTGGCVCALGFAFSSLSETILVFLLAYGVVGGIGFGMNSISGHIIVNSYFNKKRGIAQGIVSSGAGAGVFLIAPLKQYTLSEYGWRGTVLIFAGIVLNFCVCACLMRPFQSDNAESDSNCEKTSIRVFEEDMDSPITETNTTLLDKSGVTNITRQLQNVLSGTSESQYKINEVEEDIKRFSEKYIQVTKNYELENGDVAIPLLKERPRSKTVSVASNGFCTTELRKNSERNRCISEFISDKNDYVLQANVNGLSSLPNLTKSHKYITEENRAPSNEHSSQTFDPFKRKDIFFSGSLYNLKEFQQTNNIDSFIESMTICDTKHDNSNIYDDRWADNVCVHSLKELARHLCDFSVLRNKLFVLVLIGAVFIQMSQYIPNTFIAEYAYSIDINEGQISIIVALYGISNIFGRLSAGCLANVNCINPLWLCNFGTAMCGVACFLFPLCNSFLSLSFYAVGQGYFIGYFAPLQILVLVNCLGLDKLTSSIGFLQMAKGPAAIAGPPIAGISNIFGRLSAGCLANVNCINPLWLCNFGTAMCGVACFLFPLCNSFLSLSFYAVGQGYFIGLVYEWTKSYGTAVQFAGILSFIAVAVQSIAAVLDRCCNENPTDYATASKDIDIVIPSNKTTEKLTDERNSAFG